MRHACTHAARSPFGARGSTPAALQVFSEHLTGLDFYLNANMIDPGTATHITEVLQNALNVLKKRAAASA
jgi:hypothetical protein